MASWFRTAQTCPLCRAQLGTAAPERELEAPCFGAAGYCWGKTGGSWVMRIPYIYIYIILTPYYYYSIYKRYTLYIKEYTVYIHIYIYICIFIIFLIKRTAPRGGVNFHLKTKQHHTLEFPMFYALRGSETLVRLMFFIMILP